MVKVMPHCFKYVCLLVHLVNVIAVICTLRASHLIVNVAFSRQMVNYRQKTVKFGNSSKKLGRVSPQLFHVFIFVA